MPNLNEPSVFSTGTYIQRNWMGSQIMDAGYSETWLDTDDLRIMTCRLTCIYVN